MTPSSGIVVLHKPAGITSRDAVDTACRQLRTREIGHCGTLDPLATGVLVLVVGRARRLQELLSRSRKSYRATVRLGTVSETDDAEGPLTVTEPAPAPPSREDVERVLTGFVGEIEQRPPRFSAVKVDGKRLYDLARKGEKVEAPVRKVRVFSIEVVSYSYPDVILDVNCAGGTYVRSIARDLGAALGCGGYLAELCRTASGSFQLEDGVAPDQLTGEQVLPLERALQEFPRIDIAAMQGRRLGHGAVVRAELPPLRLDQEDLLFGWVNGHAVALLKRQGHQKVRSQRLLVTVDELNDLCAEELAAQDAGELPPRPY